MRRAYQLRNTMSEDDTVERTVSLARSNVPTSPGCPVSRPCFVERAHEDRRATQDASEPGVHTDRSTYMIM